MKGYLERLISTAVLISVWACPAFAEYKEAPIVKSVPEKVLLQAIQPAIESLNYFMTTGAVSLSQGSIRGLTRGRMMGADICLKFYSEPEKPNCSNAGFKVLGTYDTNHIDYVDSQDDPSDTNAWARYIVKKAPGIVSSLGTHMGGLPLGTCESLGESNPGGENKPCFVWYAGELKIRVLSGPKITWDPSAGDWVVKRTALVTAPEKNGFYKTYGPKARWGGQNGFSIGSEPAK